MRKSARHDAWQAGDSYDLYMGRWSRQIAPRFLEWFDQTRHADWLEVGCGTGALSAAIVAQCNPKSLVSVDPSAGFLQTARAAVPEPSVQFQVGDAQSLTFESGRFDAVVSALVLNFVPDREKALAEMRRVARVGGRVGFYVWDYPGGGVGFMRAFWNAATSLDPSAADLTESVRFPFCTPEGLTDLAVDAGLRSVQCIAIETPSVFRDFEDLWHPFTLGAGPAPGYCMSLAPEARERLREKLRDSLPTRDDGSIILTTRAWAIKGQAT